MKPNLFLVGCPRSGTTTLYNLLNSHLEIYMSPVKGPNFFGESENPVNKTYHKNKSSYMSLYHKRHEKWLGDASHYFSSETIPKEIKKFNPHAKIIIILRDPIEFIISSYSINKLEEGLDQIKIFQKNSLKEKELEKNLEYSLNLKRYLKIFGTENVLILFFEDLKYFPKKIKKALGKFLKVPPSGFSNILHTNFSSKKNKNTLRKILILFPPSFKIFIKKNIPKRRLMKIQGFLEGHPKKEKIKFNYEMIPKKLKIKSHLEKKRVEKLLKINLNLWELYLNKTKISFKEYKKSLIKKIK